MAQNQKKVFDGIFAQLEETDGNVVLFDAKGRHERGHAFGKIMDTDGQRKHHACAPQMVIVGTR